MNIIQLVIVLFSTFFINAGSDNATQADQEPSSLGYEFVDNYDIIDEFSKDWHDFQISLVSNREKGCYAH
jgi:hypothetical protein|tara:strand:- start:152 stop:361 length:210 start_codon:yes stop_codon:yes gene_type:complete